MKIAIRTDASVAIGTGHVMRCLTLADLLKAQGAEVLFICRKLPGNCCDLIKSKGYSVSRLPDYDFNVVNDANLTLNALTGNKPDWLIIDHYGIAAEWEQRLRPEVEQIMVIDDLANRLHDCDLLLDQNLYENIEKRYDGLVPTGCRMLLGPGYALIRKEFVEARLVLRKRDGIFRRLLVFYGGSDPTNETEKALNALASLNRPDICIDVVIGSTNPNSNKIRNLCVTIPNVTLHIQVNNMAELMSNADLALGAGGATIWERCYLGLPSILSIVADNQCETTVAVANAGAAWNLGYYADVAVDDILGALNTCLATPSLLKAMGEESLKIMGGFNSAAIVDILCCKGKM